MWDTMWQNITALLTFIAAVLFLFWVTNGIYVCQRYGSAGVSFLWSKDFPKALNRWQSRHLEEKRRAEVVGKLEDTYSRP